MIVINSTELHDSSLWLLIVHRLAESKRKQITFEFNCHRLISIDQLDFQSLIVIDWSGQAKHKECGYFNVLHGTNWEWQLVIWFVFHFLLYQEEQSMPVKSSENTDEEHGAKAHRVWHRVSITMYLSCGLHMHVSIHKN